VPFAALSAVGLACWLREDPTRLLRRAAATTLLPERSSPIGVGVGIEVVSENQSLARARDGPCPRAADKRAGVDDADPER